VVASADLISYAQQQLGKPYVFGAAGPGSFDCSGLMLYVFKHYGINLPRGSRDQAKVGIAIPKGQQRPGDLVFSHWGSEGPSGHVGMYVGDGKILNAPHTGANVRYATLDSSYMTHVDAIRRIPGVDGTTGTPINAILGAAAGAAGGGLVDAVSDAAGALHDIGKAVAPVGTFAETLTKLALPSNAVRLASGVLGVGFLLVGLLFLLREVRT
jgi:hypothetical protein